MQKRKGISLIVLVITIIVMIVLAGAIILSLNNAGIIERANEAVKDTDEATVKELAQMAWAEAYAEGVRSVEDAKVNNKDVEGFKKRVEKTLQANGINKEGNIQYFINVTEKGVNVKPIEEAWVLNQTDLKVKRGEEELIIGQTVKYKAGGTDYAGEWKVLGADDNGNLLIMSTSDVKTEYKLGGKTLNDAVNSYLNGETILNNECKSYAVGSQAISARSVTVEDINKITGYEPKTSGYGKETIYAYGNEVTYKYNATLYPEYECSNGIKDKTLTTEHSKGFHWYDKQGSHKVEAVDLTNEANRGKKIVTMISNAYSYYGTTLTTSPNGKIQGLATDTEAYKMIFGTSDNLNNYWLASSYVRTYPNYVIFGMRDIQSGTVDFKVFMTSSRGVESPIKGVRAVVTISSDVAYQDLVNI